MVIGDLNAEVNLKCLKLLRETYHLNSFIKVSTYKNPEMLSRIHLLLTNRSKSFQSLSLVGTGL